MRFTFARISTILMVVCALAFGAAAQVRRNQQTNNGAKRNASRIEPARKENSPPQNNEGSEKSKAQDEQQEPETVKVNTNLVTVPIIASTREGVYVADMRQEEFEIYEDGIRQKLSFFATTTEPFHVILMLDTSASAQEKLREIQRAAIAFLQQLQPADRVKIISFDDEIQDLNEFTNDQALLRVAIRKTRAGRGTKLYDAMQLALDTMRDVKGRKAVVIFTDGVDLRSDNWRYDDNIKMLEESGVIVYPIRYDTRLETEQLARQQAEEIGVGQSDDLGRVIGAPRSGTTAPTFPGGRGIPYPSGRTSGKSGSNLPPPSILIQKPRSNPNDPRRTGGGRSSDGSPVPTDSIGRANNDSIGMMLDRMYSEGDAYLRDIAEKSGGRLTRADTLTALPAAFAEIAAELRTQYSLGYYPIKTERDGQFRKIQVKTTRKDVAVRARPGYRTQGW